MEKSRVADVLEEIALLLEVSGESSFKSRAYENAARTIRHLDQDLMQLVQEGRLKELKGSEVDILPDGSLDYPEEVLRTLDFVVASVHSSFGLPKDEQTRRIVKALKNPRTTILGHPTGRLLLRREAYAVDLREILANAAREGVYVELNANPHRLDLDSAACRLGRSLGARFAIDPDAHDEEGLQDVRFGVAVARRAGLRASDVLNTVPAEHLDAALARGR